MSFIGAMLAGQYLTEKQKSAIEDLTEQINHENLTERINQYKEEIDSDSSALFEDLAEQQKSSANSSAETQTNNNLTAIKATSISRIFGEGKPIRFDVLYVYIKAGDYVAAGDTLINLKTDKYTIDMPAAAAGYVAEVCVEVGDEVSADDVICYVQSTQPDQSIEETILDSAPSGEETQEKKMSENTQPSQHKQANQQPSHFALQIYQQFEANQIQQADKTIRTLAKEQPLFYVGEDYLWDVKIGLLWRVVNRSNAEDYYKFSSRELSIKQLNSTAWRIPTYKQLQQFTQRSGNPWRQGNNYRLFNKYPWLCSYNNNVSATDLDYPEYHIVSSGYLIAVNSELVQYIPPFLRFCRDNHLTIRSVALKDPVINWQEMSFKDNFRHLDYQRCRLPELEDNWFTDVHQGLWEFYGLPESDLEQYGVRARNPEHDIQVGNVGIDFGTSSTVVAYSDEHNRAKLLRVGVDDFYSKPQPEHYENPTVLEFLDFENFLQAWQSMAYQPLVNWDDVRCAHEAQRNFRSNDSNTSVVSSVLGKIKQWALRQNDDYRLRITDQVHGVEHELSPLVLRNPVKGALLQVSENDVFDPIELYAWFLGLNINWRRRGIFLNYYMTFPVAYPKDVKEKILAAFRRGLMRSLPQSLAENSEVMARFSVEECATEPAAYIAVAMKAHQIEPTDEGIAYAVFDFGGGTTDFDFGYYRWADEAEEARGLEEVFEHLEGAGDKFLGGENLLENLAYLVFKHNLDLCREAKISFTRPLDAEDFAGSELLLEKTQAASTNTLMMMARLRAYWEKGEINSNGVERINLINRDGERVSCEMQLPIDELDEYLDNRIQTGIVSFFAAMKKAFQKELPSKVHVLLAGNSSRSRRVTDAFGLLPENADETAQVRFDFTQAAIEEIFGERCPEIMAYRPLTAELDDESAPTAKTGVALGILRICDGDKVKVINHTPSADTGEAGFRHYVGRTRRGKFLVSIHINDPYQEWKEIGVVSEKGIFNLFHTQSNLAFGNNMEEGHNELLNKKIVFPIQAALQKVFVRAVAPHKIELCTAQSADIIQGDNLQEYTLI